jgi:hypothetical protein
VHSFYRAIAASKPDRIIPGEDLATLHLHEIHNREQIRGSEGARIASLIERSLGAPTSFSLVYARTALMEMAQKQGVLAPATEVVRSITNLRQAMARMGHPLVLKTDASSGGFGVRIAQSPHEAEAALARLGAPPALAPVLKWAIADRDYPTLARSVSDGLASRDVKLSCELCIIGEESAGTRLSVPM